MSSRLRHWSLFAALAAVTALILGAAAWLAATAGPPLPLLLGAAGLALIAALALVWLYLDWSWLRPSHTLARELELLVHARVERDPSVPEGHALGPLPRAVAELAAGYRRLRQGHDEALAAAHARAREQQSRLEAILRDLADGVIGCSADRRILLFNDAARRILGAGSELGLDRPLDALIAREPIGHAFSLLCDRHAGRRAAGREEFVCATADGRRLLRCRMSLIDRDDGEVLGFVLDFVDATERLGHTETQTARVERLVQALRAPAAALTAAAEVLSEPGLETAARRRFVDVVGRESTRLARHIDELGEAAGELARSDWPMADLFSGDLARRVQRRLAAASEAPTLTRVGPGLWLHGDGYHLTLLIERLAHRVCGATGARAFDLEVRRGARRIELDLVWDGAPLAHGVLETWLDQPLDPDHGAARVRDVLGRHDSELWSQAHGRPGRALLRLPLPPPQRPQVGETAQDLEPLPPRPEFYDFDLLDRRAEAGPLLERRLDELGYVVFDTETTGLDPRRDQIVQIAAVRIVNRRLLTGETFDRLIDPGRAIPRTSTRFHGITDAMVRGRPPLEVVLPQFRDFAAGAVLVAHNAAFDLAFLREAEERSGVRLDQPVLDTLLLSVILHDHTPEHSLDAIAARFGIVLAERHTALGDAIGTAEVFLRMLDLLTAHGVATLGEALAASERAVEVRRRQAAQFGTTGSAAGREPAKVRG